MLCVSLVILAQGLLGTAPPLKSRGMNEQLQHVAGLRIFFGHQSVGGNLIDGLGQVAGARVRTEAVTVAALSPRTLEQPGLAHALLGENEAPHTKLAAFEQALGALDGQVDVAFFKLCYIDFAASTDVDALFTAYEAVMARLKAKYPRVTFAFVTVPLTTVQGGLKGWLKRQVGRAPWGELENGRRHAFNQRVRAAHPEALFDLARLEATRDDGTLDTFLLNGERVPKLRADFTEDGGHLNQTAQRVLANALLQFLAGLPLAAARP